MRHPWLAVESRQLIAQIGFSAGYVRYRTLFPLASAYPQRPQKRFFQRSGQMTNRTYGAKHLWLGLAAMVAVFASAGGSHALDRRALNALKVMGGANDSSLTSFGSLNSFMGRLRRAGRACRMSTYAYGANIDCGPAKAPDMLIGLDFAPTRAPEFLQVGSVRANGVNGGELPRAQLVEFLRDYLKTSPATR